MKRFNRFIQSSFLFTALTIIEGQTIIPHENTMVNKLQIEQFEQPILTPNSFSINQSFSISTIMNNGTNQTMGIFSNFTHHEISEKIKIKTAFHLMQNQNNFVFSSKPKTGYGYEVGFEYKLNSHSLFTFQVANYQNFSNFHLHNSINVP